MSSVANFAREAAIARAALWANDRGYRWSNGEAWQPVIDLISEIDRHDRRLRAQEARGRRLRGQ
jgi:hypothetical protein